MKHPVGITCTVFTLAVAGGCMNFETHNTNLGTLPDGVTHAITVLTPTKGSTVHGTVTFEQYGSRVEVTAHVAGLEPGSVHAWHIHEYGDISAENGTATGGHYNPEGHPHALPNRTLRHAGDLGNLTADATGHARAEIMVSNVTVDGAMNPILGRAIIIHAKVDDGGQPTGNAGARIAQGVIGVAKPE